MSRVRVIGCLTPKLAANKSPQSSQPGLRRRTFQTIQYMANSQGPMASSDRHGLGCVFCLRGGFACVSYGMYTASGGIPNARGPYGFEMDGSVFILPNLAIGIVWGPQR